MEHKTEWVRCPVCSNKTRLPIQEDTELKNVHLYFPKCKQESLINAKDMQITFLFQNFRQLIQFIGNFLLGLLYLLCKEFALPALRNSLLCQQAGAFEAPSTVRIMCRTANKKVEGLEDFHFHMLRHADVSTTMNNLHSRYKGSEAYFRKTAG